MATMLSTSSTTMRPFAARPAARKPSRSVRLQAAASAAPATSRRAAIAGIAIIPLMWTAQAKALLLDEDDEEMVTKAKANRKSRLATQKQTTNSFLETEGLTNKKLESELIPVQKAIYKLAQSGSQLESGDVQAVSAVLSEGWVEDFKNATVNFPSASAQREQVVASLDSLVSSASASDLKATKQSFVAVVSSLQTWATAAEVTALITGL